MQCGSRPSVGKGKAAGSLGRERHKHQITSAGVVALACMQDGKSSNTGSPAGGTRKPTDFPQGTDWAVRVADGSVVPVTRGNARRGKGPSFKSNTQRGKGNGY